jgi:hypothetical protein
MLSVQIQQHKSLEGKLVLEDAVHELAILTAVRIIDAVIRAHNGPDAGLDAIHERPKVVFMEGLVIYIGRLSLDTEVGPTVRFLLIADEVLASLSVNSLDTMRHNGTCHGGC